MRLDDLQRESKSSIGNPIEAIEVAGMSDTAGVTMSQKQGDFKGYKSLCINMGGASHRKAEENSSTSSRKSNEDAGLSLNFRIRSLPVSVHSSIVVSVVSLLRKEAICSTT